MKTHILGFPRIGARRELKKSLESYWRGEIPFTELEECARQIRLWNWQTQKKAGLSMVAVGDFSLYDHVLDTSLMLGAVPPRFRHLYPDDPDMMFLMARGDEKKQLRAMEMTKWFNTNYHYIVPEISGDFQPSFACRNLIRQTQEAIQAGFVPKPVLLGPFTYLSLAKGTDGYDCWQKLPELICVYEKILRELASLAAWIQMDEPALASGLPPEACRLFPEAYRRLNCAAGKSGIILATSYAPLDDHLDLALNSGCTALHVDLVNGGDGLEQILQNFPKDMILSAGVVDGHNIWRNNFTRSLETLKNIRAVLGSRMMVSSSCSLLHVPVDLALETGLDPELSSWMSFAVQKCREISLLGEMLEGIPHSEDLLLNRRAVQNRHDHPAVHNPAVAARQAAVTDAMRHRTTPYPSRREAQNWLKLPLFPTTTIGSFPQTDEIRKTRQAFRKGRITHTDYEDSMKEEIRKVIACQEKLGLDVLVHGEPERNDMVEYFGQQLDGFCFTENGWVQSYGSRCVKPPVIYGDVSRRGPMTVDWITYAQSLTDRPMKGMLTGPVTILCWSFVRDDLERSQVCEQLALAIRDEVRDLEQAGIRIIQIDEAAFSEGMPVKRRDREKYFRWAAGAFRLATSGVADSTQIHTHMCYSEFNSILPHIADLDADVISIESSRSGMEILKAFQSYEYPNEIGPGVYDIHSPRIPTADEMTGLLERAAEYIPRNRLWVNPDCGLKTRNWEEVLPSLANMVTAAANMRQKYAG